MTFKVKGNKFDTSDSVGIRITGNDNKVSGCKFDGYDVPIRINGQDFESDGVTPLRKRGFWSRLKSWLWPS